jgi:hypothetical protein
MMLKIRNPDPKEQGVRSHFLFCGIAVLQCCGFGVNGNTAEQHNGSTKINHLRLAPRALT